MLDLPRLRALKSMNTAQHLHVVAILATKFSAKYQAVGLPVIYWKSTISIYASTLVQMRLLCLTQVASVVYRVSPS